jgi:hypothetical protein
LSGSRRELTMNRLFLAIWFLFIWILPAVGETPYCAFEVRVRKPSGTPFAKVSVAMVERGGESGAGALTETQTDATGKATLCDAPLHPVDIIVGLDVCGAVWVRGVRAVWPTTRQIVVTYDGDSCHDFAFSDHCQALLRIQDDGGRPVVGAQFNASPSEQSRSDVFGRLFRSLKNGENLSGVVFKDGYEPAQVSEACLDYLELKIVLHKR